MSIAQKTLAIIATAAVSAAVVFSFVSTIAVAEAATLTSAQVQAIVSLLQSFGADSSTIANVQASLNGTAPVMTGTTGTVSSACTFTRDLTVGAKGADVTCLQNALIAAGYSIPAGATGYFGSQSVSAVMAWQKAAGVSPAAGYFGAKSRAAFNLGGTTGTTGGTTGGTTTTPAGTGLTVAAGVQPVASLAPKGASHVPFTRFTLTAGSDGDVTVNSVTVQRTGLGADAAFQGVILIDEATGMQLGTAKTMNSNHQATIGGTFVVPKGTTKSYLVAGNMASDLSAYTGQAPSIAVVAVNTSANVTGSLPITGAAQTLNNTLSVGTMTLDVSNAYSSNSPANEAIGTTGYAFTGFRLTAGSAEDVRLHSVTWNQTGSVSATDLANVVTVVNGTSYPTTVSPDGKYLYTSLGSGVVIAKGNSVDVYVKGDIIGSNASGRTVIFDVDKNTDVFATGETYGYGISPVAPSTAVPTTRTSQVAVTTSGTPYLYAAQVTVTGASVTTIAKANSVPSQNIAINLANQPLGGFTTNITGEAMTVQQMVFHVATTTGASQLTNVTLVDENGSVVAGPVDEPTNATNGSTLTFTDTVTIPTGPHTYTLRGKVSSSGAATDGTYQISSTPSSDWTNVKGETSGNTISLASMGQFTMNTMTIKAGTLAIGVSSNPASQTIVPGGSQVLFANFQFDASQSGEDVRFSSIPVTLTMSGTTPKGNISSCQFYDGSQALNSGSNVLNPSDSSSQTTYTKTVTLDNPITVTKGTVKTIGIRCNVSGSANTDNQFSFAPVAASFSISGATSGTALSATPASSPTITVSLASGTATVSSDASTPGYTIASAGSTDVLANVLKFHANNEPVNLTKIGFDLDTTNGSSSDVVKATIYNGSTAVGYAYFTGNATQATSTLSQVVQVPANGDLSLTVKVDLATIGTGQPVTVSGHLVKVNYTIASGSQGVGANSGSTVYPSGTATAAGIRMVKSFPTIAKDTLASTGIADGVLMHFKVTADAQGPVGITQFALNIATSTGVGVTNIAIYGFTDANYSQPISGVSSSGDLRNSDIANVPLSGDVVIGITDSSGNPTAIQVPAGQTRYFEARASISGVVSGSSVTTKLTGNASQIAGTSMVQAAAAGSAFVWSPNSTTTASRTEQDWTNGAGVNGLPSGGLIQTRSN